MSRFELIELKQAADDARERSAQADISAVTADCHAAEADADEARALARFLRAVLDEAQAITGQDCELLDFPDALADAVAADDARQQSFRRELGVALYLNPVAGEHISDPDLVRAVREQVGRRQQVEAELATTKAEVVALDRALTEVRLELDNAAYLLKEEISAHALTRAERDRLLEPVSGPAVSESEDHGQDARATGEV